jgi:hypothetical protein
VEHIREMFALAGIDVNRSEDRQRFGRQHRWVIDTIEARGLRRSFILKIVSAIAISVSSTAALAIGAYVLRIYTAGGH